MCTSVLRLSLWIALQQKKIARAVGYLLDLCTTELPQHDGQGRAYLHGLLEP